MGLPTRRVLESKGMKKALLLFGSFCIGYNLSNFLHELGHACAAWLTGGGVRAIIIHPFGWNWTQYVFGSISNYEFATWGGIGFGVAFAAAISLLALLKRSPWLQPLHMLGPVALAMNGVYYATSLIKPVGDPVSLIRYGHSQYLMGGIGVGLLVLSLLWAIAIQPLVGLSNFDPMRRRLGVLVGGIGSYLALMALYTFIRQPSDQLMWYIQSGFGVLFACGIAVFGHLLRKPASLVVRFKPCKPTWTQALSVGLAGIALIVTLLCLLPEGHL